MKSSIHLASALLLGSLVLSSGKAIAAKGEPVQPLTLLHMTSLPEITGDFDHFAVDLPQQHRHQPERRHRALTRPRS